MNRVLYVKKRTLKWLTDKYGLTTLLKREELRMKCAETLKKRQLVFFQMRLALVWFMESRSQVVTEINPRRPESLILEAKYVSQVFQYGASNIYLIIADFNMLRSFILFQRHGEQVQVKL